MNETVPPGDDADYRNCPKIVEMLGRIGDRWSARVMMTLHREPRRFNELKRIVVGVSQQMLRRTLENLERDGIVRRTVQPTVPPRVEYALTDLGTSLIPPVLAMGNWIEANLADITARRDSYDQLHDDGASSSTKS